MTSSIASLRLKAKQHSSGFSYSPVTTSSRSATSSGLSACQYATAGGGGGGGDRGAIWRDERIGGGRYTVEDLIDFKEENDKRLQQAIKTEEEEDRTIGEDVKMEVKCLDSQEFWDVNLCDLGTNFLELMCNSYGIEMSDDNN